MTAPEKRVSRAGVAAALLFATALGARASGPGESGPGTPPLSWVLPSGVTVLATSQDGDRLDVYLGGSASEARWTEEGLEALVRACLDDAYEAGLGVRGVIPWALRDGAWVPLPALLPPVPPVPRKPFELKSSPDPDQAPPARIARALVGAVGSRRAGGLTGKVVYVSAGHGFTWDPSLGRWTTQRGNTNDIVEDLVSAETVDQLLTTYLENAGATVFTVRERDMNPEMVIVDADAGGATGGSGRYVESGAWQDSVSGGFSASFSTYGDGDNPFAAGASRVAATEPSASATARWSFSVPTAGDFRVYAAWVAGQNRAPDAHYVVHHAGGEAHFRVDQRRHGSTWVSLGRFRFDRDGEVELRNDSAAPGSYVSADAIRVGGGMGDARRGDGVSPPESPTSQRPRWEENARYHIQFSGAPESVYVYASDERSDDVGARSRYAAWQNEVGEDAVYVAWHTNAPSPGTGTSTYVYGPNPPDGSYDFTGTPGSDVLASLLHHEVVSDLQAAVDPGWRDRGIFSAYFGEINKNHNAEMPSVLCEVAFHATESDATYLKDPKVRQVAARAFYQAITRYFAERDGLPTRLLPEPPEAVRARATGADQARLEWRAAPVDDQDLGGDAATGFRVYRSADGLAWGDGVDVADARYDVTGFGGQPGFFRVTAFNEGGESLPSPVVAVLPPCEGGATSLIVYGFYRVDAGLAPRDDLSAWDLGSVVRMRLQEMNRFDGVVPHAWALAHAGLAFDSAEATALDDVALAAYGLVDWVLGEESTADETLSDAEQAFVTSWLGPGKTLLVSGAELAWDLGDKGSPSDRAFLASLGASYAADDAGTYQLSWSGGQLTLDDGTLGGYDVQFPDVLAAAPGADAEVVLRYAGDAVAGLRARAAGTAVVLGVPLESLFPVAAREAFVAAMVDGAEVARASCEVGPEPGVEVVEEAEPAEPDAIAEADAIAEPDAVVVEAVEGATALRPSRQATSTVHEIGGGCTSNGGGSLVSLAMLFTTISLLVRRRSDDRPA